jgi:ankyrin repeat protein
LAQDGTTPLHLAAAVGDAGMLAALLAAGAGLEAQNCEGQTPLFEAAAAGHAEAVRWLMQAHADLGEPPPLAQEVYCQIIALWGLL